MSIISLYDIVCIVCVCCFYRILWLLSIHCPNVKWLSYSSEEFPPSAESLWSLTNGCGSLQHLHLSPVLGSPNQGCYNDSALRVIAIGWPNLVSLTVGGKFISVDGLAEIGEFYFHLIGNWTGVHHLKVLCYSSRATSNLIHVFWNLTQVIFQLVGVLACAFWRSFTGQVLTRLRWSYSVKTMASPLSLLSF